MIARINTGLALLAVLFMAIYFGGWVFSILWVASVCIAMYEMFRALSLAGHRPITWPSWIALIISIPSFLLLNTSTASSLILMLTVVLSFLIVSTLVMFRENPRLEDLVMSVLPLFTVALPGISLLALTRVNPQGYQRLLLTLNFLIPVCDDACAYFVGIRFGHVKLNEAISPNKTVEGALGGLLGSVLAGIVIYTAGVFFSIKMPPFAHFVLLGLVGGIVGQIGDLYASLVKRHCQIKDFGKIFPGHGGMMDRLDSILFVSVMMFLYQAIF